MGQAHRLTFRAALYYCVSEDWRFICLSFQFAVFSHDGAAELICLLTLALLTLLEGCMLYIYCHTAQAYYRGVRVRSTVFPSFIWSRCSDHC